MRREGDLDVEVLVVFRHGDEVGQLRRRTAVEFREVLLDERARQLTGAVSAEVGEDDGVAVLDLGHLALLVADGGCVNELVRFAAGVGHFHRFAGGIRLVFRFATGDDVVGFLDALPAIVAVHGVVAPDDGANAHPLEGLDELFHLLDVIERRLGCDVAAIGKRVDAHLGATVDGHLDGGLHVVDMAVYTAVGKQSEHVHGAAGFCRLVDGFGEHGIVEEGAVLDGQADASQFLIDHAACPKIEVTHFGVAHLPVGQTDDAPAGVDQRVGVVVPQLVKNGGVGQRDGIVIRRFAIAPAIQDDQTGGAMLDGVLLLFALGHAFGPVFLFNRFIV